MIRLALYLLIAGGLAAGSFWIYLRAEMSVRRSRALAGIRAAVLVLILLLLFDPVAPWGRRAGDGGRWVLLDASLSMGAGDGDGWAGASGRALRLAEEGWRVVRFGEGLDEGGGAAPTDLESRLGPALARAAEAGAERVRVLSDLRFEDPVAVRSALAASASPVDFEAFGEGAPNAGIASFSVEDQVRVGDPTRAELDLFAGGIGDSVLVEVREEGRLVLARTEAVPAPGLRARVVLDLPPPEGRGRLRYTAVVRGSADAFLDDDEAVAYMSAGHDAGGLVLVSLRPDWEPRALLSVLERATGLQASGYLRVGPDRFLPMGPAVRRGPAVDSTTVGSAVSEAVLVVVHGLGGATDAWGRALPTRAARALLWPVDPSGAEAVGLGVGAARPGEWYASPDLPGSPLAADLAGAPLQDLPPLSALLPPGGDADGIVPLRVQLGGTGPGQPVLLLRRAGGRRTAVALASGFWRWEARDGAARDAYTRLWSGVAGWLLTEDRSVTAGEPRPERWVVPRGEAVRWRLPGGEGDSVAVRIASGDETVWEGSLASGVGVGSGVLPPGSYTYRAETSGGGTFDGRFDVEARTLEMLPAPFRADAPEGGGAGTVLRGSSGPPLSTTPWIFLLVIALLCGEWIWRRRVGLR